jgi:hypothetical protein
MRGPVDHRVGGHRQLRHLVAAAPGQGEAQDELAVHPQRARHRAVGAVEGDVLDRLGEAPDRPAGFAGELLVDRQPTDVGARLVGGGARGRDEERDADLEVVAQVVVAVVDHGQHHLAAPRLGLDDVELRRHQGAGGAGVDGEHGGAGRRVAHHARHDDRPPGDLVGDLLRR